MAGNASLNEAAQAREDEFYTRLEDIENELRHYKEHFKGKTVFCNCDDPYESDFFKYFAMNFNFLGLKKLIATCYVSSPVMYTQLSIFDDMEQTFTKPADPNKKPYKVEITEVTDENGDGAFDLDDIRQLLKSKKNVCTILKGDGDFRSEECIELLKEADIVVTNPPFSLFREYIALLYKYDKKFVILGNPNAVTYKEVFPLISSHKLWIGAKPWSAEVYFHIPKDKQDYLVKNKKEKSAYVIIDGEILGRAPCLWFTNLDIAKRHEDLILYKTYSPEEYSKYANYDAIDVSKVTDIPCDYYGVMGVPITFLDKYNPNQFEILGISLELAEPMKDIAPKGSYMPGGKRFYTQKLTAKDKERGYLYHREYDRIVIRRKEQPQ